MTYAANVNVVHAEPQPEIGYFSPSKLATAGLEQSPMFAPLEVKFKNLKKLDDSAKKHMSGRKYAKIDNNAIGARMQ